MPKTKKSLDCFLREIVKAHPGEFSTDNKILFCNLCGTSVNFPSQKMFFVEQHQGSQTHKQKKSELAFSLATSPQLSQQLISTAISTQTSSSQYAADLCEAFIAGMVLN